MINKSIIFVLPIPHIIVTYLLIDKLIFRVHHKLNKTYTSIEYYYSIKFYLLGSGFSHLLYWWGGFYDQFYIPQAIILTISFFQLVNESIRNKKKKEDSFDIIISFFNFIFMLSLLYAGHFYDNMLSIF